MAGLEPGTAQLSALFSQTIANDRVSFDGLWLEDNFHMVGAREGGMYRACFTNFCFCFLLLATHKKKQEVIKAAEEQLKLASQQPGYCIAVLKVCRSLCG
jgi:hypothetical protein